MTNPERIAAIRKRLDDYENAEARQKDYYLRLIREQALPDIQALLAMVVPMPPDDEVPRRCRMDRWYPAEKDIFDAKQTVESMGADPKLTEAVVLLGKAQECVADFIDQPARK